MYKIIMIILKNYVKILYISLYGKFIYFTIELKKICNNYK